MVNYQLHFIRHGTTQGNLEGRYIGSTDLPLCPQGRRELEALLDTREYPKVQAVYVSPLLRCRQTAELLYPESWVRVVDQLREYDFGEFEGKSMQELAETGAFPLWVTNSLRTAPPGGEDPVAFTQRILQGLQAVFYDMMEQRITSAAVVTHGGVITSLLSAVAMPRQPYSRWLVENGCGFTVVMTPQMWMRDHLVEAVGTLPYGLENGVVDDFTPFTLAAYQDSEEEE